MKQKFKIVPLVSLLILLSSVNCLKRKHYNVKGFRPIGYSIPLLFGHRGSSHYAPENTYASFEMALKQKADGIELDVNLSLDGSLIVFHDKTTARTTDDIENRNISELKLSEIEKLDAGSWFSPLFKNEKVPLLKEVLKKYYSKTGIILDIKSDESLDPLIQLLTNENYVKDIYLASASLEALEYLRNKLPKAKLIFWMGQDSQMDEIQNFSIDYIRPRHSNLMHSQALELSKQNYKLILPCSKMQAGIAITICNNIPKGISKRKKVKKYLAYIKK